MFWSISINRVIRSCNYENEPPTGAYMAFVEPNAGDETAEKDELLPFESRE